ncbi:uncharacterized protein LOC133364836 [Rhineura floridana]|uniref:uncharacterized protein LOC133364836 n=1 Tax=Rhineura floridana TaxID=261503 RepID=UPI002AC858D8|nr:uncharacterized protein LOC133364836 [Rhineura floridana]
MLLLWLVAALLALSQCAQAETYTSMLSIQEALATERELLRVLHTYLEEEANRLKDLRRREKTYTRISRCLSRFAETRIWNSATGCMFSTLKRMESYRNEHFTPGTRRLPGFPEIGGTDPSLAQTRFCCAPGKPLLEKMARVQLGSGKVALFSQKKRGGLTYRIPALLYLPSESTFLAFAEERSSPRDEDAKFLVMRRGQKEGTSVQWGPQETLMMATSGKGDLACACF